MSILLRFLTVITLLITNSSAFDWSSSYPNALFVLNELDVDESYLYDEDFVSFVEKKEIGLKRFYQKSMKRGEDEIVPTIKDIISSKEQSSLLIYLSMVESGFITTAKSNKKALGLWQFIPTTARAYNLIVTSLYDERLDIDKSTSSAIEYLQYLHNRFGKWYLAIMAYNCGEGRVSQAIKEANGDDLSLLTSSSPNYLPKETREYIKKILLVAMMGESGSNEDDIVKSIDTNSSIDIDLDLNTTKEDELKYNLTQVEIAPDTNLTLLANMIEMKEEDLRRMNPKPIKNKIKIPFQKIYLFYLKYELSIKSKR